MLGRYSRLILDSWTRPTLRAHDRPEEATDSDDRAALQALRPVRRARVLAAAHPRLGWRTAEPASRRARRGTRTGCSRTRPRPLPPGSTRICAPAGAPAVYAAREPRAASSSSAPTSRNVERRTTGSPRCSSRSANAVSVLVLRELDADLPGRQAGRPRLGRLVRVARSAPPARSAAFAGSATLASSHRSSTGCQRSTAAAPRGRGRARRAASTRGRRLARRGLAVGVEEQMLGVVAAHRDPAAQPLRGVVLERALVGRPCSACGMRPGSSGQG